MTNNDEFELLFLFSKAMMYLCLVPERTREGKKKTDENMRFQDPFLKLAVFSNLIQFQ